MFKATLYRTCKMYVFVCGGILYRVFSSKDEPEVHNGEVDEYLLCAIDARSIDRLKAQYCYPITLKFRDANIEQIVSKTCPRVHDHTGIEHEQMDIYPNKRRRRPAETYSSTNIISIISICMHIKYDHYTSKSMVPNLRPAGHM